MYPPALGLSDAERDDLTARLHRVDNGSEAVFFADQAIFTLLRSLGVKPDFLVGHSTGENAAIIASGLFDGSTDEVCEQIRRMNAIFADIETSDTVPTGTLLTIGAVERTMLSEMKARRAQLFPFLWGTVVAKGRLYGDLDEGSDAHVTNPYNFSYPGYSETLTGHADININSNDNKPNPNITVFEWLNRQPGLQGRVAAFGAWEVFSGIFNAQRCGFPVNVSYDPLIVTPTTPAIDLLNDQRANAPRVWPDEAFDAPIFSTALEYLKLKQPRVMFLSLGETDDWAHGGNYGEYLLSAHRADADLAKLWSTLQSIPQYRDNTTLIFLTDHGRGEGPKTWESHGQKLPESKNIFIGLIGPGVPAAGLEKNTAPVTQSQVAATIANLLGLDWNAQEPLAGKPLDLGR